MDKNVIKIANCSGFYGDKLSAAKDMVDGGPIDVLTGDYLAELTMTILYSQKLQRGDDKGYVGTFLKQVKEIAKDLVKVEPTNKLPISPGPQVAVKTSISFGSIFLLWNNNYNILFYRHMYIYISLHTLLIIIIGRCVEDTIKDPHNNLAI